jgi:hypothetical protein
MKFFTVFSSLFAAAKSKNIPQTTREDYCDGEIIVEICDIQGKLSIESLTIHQTLSFNEVTEIFTFAKVKAGLMTKELEYFDFPDKNTPNYTIGVIKTRLSDR